ncbi:Glycosyltransferase family 28 C-terminal domain-containing protein [Amycolatopsis pretoriensis]|uniref:Glycosyltransferase family 28 C-terminal domain-containing protein n=1 Tax=Amycolatopsis pretoriensis TaxID=218821 RepID=A0A1H5QTK8_9PSEU|nr:nucleotide disphospho-sugar-binding domain-containing protein [Amycolatopsis pretoriensis]SEF29405.1 Glycosyltransferase family 28 C-terminal domain-containing protein [Amycolatopsis pretoriensis]
MRVLFAGLASAGHTYPMVPLAVAARDVGHEVHFAAGEHVHAPLDRLGLNPFRPADSFYEIYAEDLEPDLKRLRPDLVVHGWGVPEVAVAAERAGIPALWHGFGRLFPDGIGLVRPAGETHLDICPPSLQDKDFLATADRIALRPVPFAEPGDFRGPLIYLTLGTAFGTPEVLETAIEGLAALGTPIVVATGGVPLRAQPAHVTARAWIPQAAAIAQAELVVHHGGSGTTLSALAAGVPQLVLPQGADQFANAEALVAVGAGVRLLPGELSADAVAEQARKAYSCREAAQAVAAEIAAMPSPDEVARELPKHAK